MVKDNKAKKTTKPKKQKPQPTTWGSHPDDTPDVWHPPTTEPRPSSKPDDELPE